MDDWHAEGSDGVWPVDPFMLKGYDWEMAARSC